MLIAPRGVWKPARGHTVPLPPCVIVFRPFSLFPAFHRYLSFNSFAAVFEPRTFSNHTICVPVMFSTNTNRADTAVFGWLAFAAIIAFICESHHGSLAQVLQKSWGRRWPWSNCSSDAHRHACFLYDSQTQSSNETKTRFYIRSSWKHLSASLSILKVLCVSLRIIQLTLKF